MLPKKNRLSSFLFQTTFQKGWVFAIDSILLKYSPSKETVSKFAVVISNKIAKKAVLRNRLKRLFHEAIRLNLSVVKKPISGILIIKNIQINTLAKADTIIKVIFNKIQY
jgi:ribonuclease P protein component